MPLFASLKWAWYYFSICPLKWAIIGFYEGDISYRAIIQCSVRSVFLSRTLFLSRRYRQPLSRMSFICPCVTVQLRSASQFLWEVSLGSQCVGEDFCLAPHLSIAYLNHAHSCHPSCRLPISLSAVTRSKISVFHLVVPCFTLFFETKRHFSDCHPDDDWQGTESSVVLIPLKSFRKWILAVKRTGHGCSWRINTALSWKLRVLLHYECVVIKVAGRFLRLMWGPFYTYTGSFYAFWPFLYR